MDSISGNDFFKIGLCLILGDTFLEALRASFLLYSLRASFILGSYVRSVGDLDRIEVLFILVSWSDRYLWFS